MPIPRPDLEIRDEDRLAAEAIGKTSGGITVERLTSQIREREQLRALIQSGNFPLSPTCPELTNANPSSPHVVFLEAMAWLLGQMAYRINQIPDQNTVAFHNLFGIELRPATRAETVLRFTWTGVSGISIPAGTQVSDAAETIVFETIGDVEGVIAAEDNGVGTIDVPARRTTGGHTLLAPNALATMIDQIAFVTSVTNPFAVDGGSSAETIDSGLERARQYQQRGERIVSDRDIENAITTEILSGAGIVRVFPFVKNGRFNDEPMLGYSTVVLTTANGFPVDDATKKQIAKLFEQLQGNQYFAIADAEFVTFNVAASVVLQPDAAIPIVAKEIDHNLREFYSVRRANFGRPILRSEILTEIENTTGVNYVHPQSANQILIAPTIDSFIYPWQLPKVGVVTIDEFNG
ncbi:MAG: baseplate J/gp47 family protein [Acidobacteriota bacterium]|nr:baseplate J/gp47 family protein [Acidobacteriota bacterium]